MKALFGEGEKFSAALSHDLFTVVDGKQLSYGGSQNMYATQKEKSCGCGITGAADVILYIEAGIKSEYTVSKDTFLELSRELRNCIPIIPGRGVNAFLLAHGLNRYFRKHKMKYRSRWKWTSIKKWETVEKMLADDIPVILAIGNNFPRVWGKKELNLYIKDETESAKNKAGTEKNEAVYTKQQSVCGHFVIATAIEGNVLTVSSWGKKFYINIDEYNNYVKKHSINIYSNILEIKKK